MRVSADGSNLTAKQGIQLERIAAPTPSQHQVGVAQMTTNLNTAAPERQRTLWFRVVQVLLLAVFVVAVYLLGLGMVHHRFFQGSRVDRFGHVRQ